MADHTPGVALIVPSSVFPFFAPRAGRNRIGELLTGFGELATAGRRSRVTVIGLIDARLGGTGAVAAVAAAEQSVSATGAPAFAAARLGCDTGEALLRIDRLYFDGEDAPVELAVSYFDPEHYSYRVRLRRRSR